MPKFSTCRSPWIQIRPLSLVGERVLVVGHVGVEQAGAAAVERVRVGGHLAVLARGTRPGRPSSAARTRRRATDDDQVGCASFAEVVRHASPCHVSRVLSRVGYAERVAARASGREASGMRTHRPPAKNTNAFFAQAGISFAIALLTMVFAVIYLPVDPWIRAFLGLGAMYLTTSAFTLAKCVRDAQENQAVVRPPRPGPRRQDPRRARPVPRRSPDARSSTAPRGRPGRSREPVEACGRLVRTAGQTRRRPTAGRRQPPASRSCVRQRRGRLARLPPEPGPQHRGAVDAERTADAGDEPRRRRPRSATIATAGRRRRRRRTSPGASSRDPRPTRAERVDPRMPCSRGVSTGLRLGRGTADRVVRLAGPPLGKRPRRCSRGTPPEPPGPTTFTPSKRTATAEPEPTPAEASAVTGQPWPATSARRGRRQAARQRRPRRAVPGAKLPPREPSTPKSGVRGAAPRPGPGRPGRRRPGSGKSTWADGALPARGDRLLRRAARRGRQRPARPRRLGRRVRAARADRRRAARAAG